jgi:hypothetical protein
MRAAAQPANTLNLLSKWWFWLAFAFTVLFLQFLFMSYAIGLYDEGLVLYGSVRVLHGDFPYRDFWTMYGPGQFALFATAFRLFGIYALWERVIYVLTNLVTLASFFYLAATLTRRLGLALFATAVALGVIAGTTDGSYAFPMYEALALVMAAIVFLTIFWQRGDRRWLLLSGLMTGLVVLFRHDMGLYTAIALCVANSYFRLSSDNAPRAERLRSLVKETLWFFFMIAIIVLPVVMFLFKHVPLHDIVYSLLYVPARIYPKVRNLPFPNVLEMVPVVRRLIPPDKLMGRAKLLPLITVYVPIAAVITTIVCFLSQRRKDLERWKISAFFLLALIAALMFIKGFVRASPHHMTPAIVPSVLLFFGLLSLWPVLMKRGQIVLALSSLFVLMCVLGPIKISLQQGVTTLHRLRPQDPNSFAQTCRNRPGLERVRCLTVPPDTTDAVLYVEQHTTPDQKIYVGAGRHDKLFANDISFYFLSERESATKWHDLHPGVETTAPIQQEMIAQLNSNHAIYVVRDSYLDNVREPNDGQFSGGVFALDHYIDANYKPEKSIGTMLILRRDTPFSTP